jgi:hypothetical protein
MERGLRLEVMEVEWERLTVLVVGNHDLARGLDGGGITGFLLALRPFLGLFRLFFLAGALLLPFCEGCT